MGYGEHLADLELGLDIFTDILGCERAGDGLERCKVKLLTLALHVFSSLVSVQRPEKFLDPSASAGEEPHIMSSGPIRILHS